MAGNEVNIRVTMTDGTGPTYEKIKKGAEKTGTDAGDELGTKFRESVGKQTPPKLPVEAKDPIDEAWRSRVQASIKSIAADAIKIPMTPDTAKYREELQLAVGELQSAVKQRIPVDTDQADQFKMHVEELAREVSAEVKAKIPVEPTVDKPAAAQAGKDAADAINDAAKKRAKENSSDLTTALWMSLVPAAPLVGAAAGAALAGGLALGLAGGVAAVAATNDQVRQQFTGLTSDIKQNAHEWGDDVAVPVSQALNRVRSSFDALAPEVGQSLTNVSQDFGILAGAATDFATNIMPGVVAASGRLQPVFAGLRQLAGGLGSELSTDFDLVSQHSGQVGTTLSSVGTIVDSLLRGVTDLATQGLDVYAQHSAQVEAGVHSLVSALTGLTSGALPALGSAFGGEIQIITSFLGALQGISPELGAVGGFALSAYSNIKLLGTVAQPMNSLATMLKSAGTEGSVFSSVTSKLGSGLDRVGANLPAVGIGFAALGTIVDLVAQHERDLVQAGDDVGTALAKGGAGAAAAQQQLAQWKQQAADAQKTLDSLGTSTGTADAAAARFGQTQSIAASSQVNANESLSDANTQIQSALDAYNKYTASLGATAATVDQLTGKQAIYSDSAQSAASNTSEINAAMQVLNSAASTAQQRIQALQTDLAALSDNGLERAQDYAAQFGQAADTFAQQITTAKGSVFNLNGELNTNSERGRDVLTVLEQSRQAWVGQAQAMASAGQTTDQINAALQGNQDQLAGVLTQAGLTKNQIQDLINKYGLIPKDITTKVNADTGDAYKAVDGMVRYFNGLRAVVHVDAVTGNTSMSFGSGYGAGGHNASAHGGVLGAATGMVLPGGLRVVGEQGAEIIREAAGSSVIPRSGVDSAITNALAGVGGGGGASQVSVAFTGSTDSALATVIMKLIKTGQIQIQQRNITN